MPQRYWGRVDTRMRNGAEVAVIIPAFNEEPAIGKVLETIPAWVDSVVVADNASTDATAAIARARGATVVYEPERGYGAACLRGIEALNGPDVVVFLDADLSDDPREMGALVDPIAADEADLVIGSRALGTCEPGALTPQQRFGNWLACGLLHLFWGVRHTDLGPFRAIRFETLRELDMRDRNYGWTVEMQIKAARNHLRVTEVPVRYRKRVGTSKISGTVRGVVAAGTKILHTIFREALFSPRRSADEERLILFARYPAPGQTKTRMIPALGPEGAAELHRSMTAQATLTARQACLDTNTKLEIWSPGNEQDAMAQWLGPDLEYRSQCPGDLGTRMADAFAQAFASGARHVLVIGSDCPGLTDRIIRKAFALLHNTELVFGPTHDGGYYLIGLRRPAESLFRDVPWGTEAVLSRTLAIADELGMSTKELPLLPDVDRPDDLPVWEEIRSTMSKKQARPALSVVIPTTNEARWVATAIASARQGGGDVEIIVVDAGSRDNTEQIAKTYGARVFGGAPGRGRQMNTGASQAQGEVLVFLHADARLPRGYAKLVEEALQTPGTVAGAFRFRMDARSPMLRLIEWGTNARSRWFQLPYGDQAFFMRRTTFEEVGGYPDWPILEDVELVRRLRWRGTIAIASVPVTTSARRWLARGPIRLTLLHQAIILGYHLGISPDRLSRWRRL